MNPNTVKGAYLKMKKEKQIEEIRKAWKEIFSKQQELEMAIKKLYYKWDLLEK